MQLCLFSNVVMWHAVSVDARLNVNVAKGRPAFQVSTYTDPNWNIFYATYANDGQHSTDAVSGPCAVTNSATNPWWAVDLGARLYVHSVNFTNVDTSCTYVIFMSVYYKLGDFVNRISPNALSIASMILNIDEVV